MQEDGYTTITELAAKLAEIETVSYRIALVKKDEQWSLSILIIDVFFARIQEDIPHYSYNYGEVAFVAGKISGAEVSKWFLQEVGNVDGYAFPLPVTQHNTSGIVSWTRYPSYVNTSFARVSFPFTVYGITNFTSPQASPMGFLVGHDVPFFPSFQAAMSQLIYGEKTQSGPVYPSIFVRIAHLEARIGSVNISPLLLSVDVEGTDLLHVRLQISGPPDLQFKRSLMQTEKVECPLPNGLPPEVWIVLSRGNKWLDYTHLNQRWSPFSHKQKNVTIDPPDLRTRIQELIAQGEGPTIEFKQEVPTKNDQMLKTVAAFANGEGGVMLVGVQNKTGNIIGVKVNVYEEKDRITNMIRNTVYPEPFIRMEYCNMDGEQAQGRQVIAIYVDKGISRPYGLHRDKPDYYVRRGATTFFARPEEVRALVLTSLQNSEYQL